jgi:hypothetical protein
MTTIPRRLIGDVFGDPIAPGLRPPAQVARQLAHLVALVTVVVCGLITVAVADDQWRNYLDPRFGMSIDYPAGILTSVEHTPEGITASGQGIRFDLLARKVPGMRSAAALAQMIKETEGYEDVTYQTAGKHWLVVSGYRDDDIFYEKFFLRGGSVQGFSMEYPASKRMLVDPLIERMEDSFRAGPG